MRIKQPPEHGVIIVDPTVQFTVEQVREAGRRTDSAIDHFFANRLQSEHDVAGLKQMIARRVHALCAAIKGDGKDTASKASDPVAYLASQIRLAARDPEIPPMRKAEYRLVLETFAQELGVHSRVLHEVQNQAAAARAAGAAT